MEVGEEHQVRAEEAILGLERLFDLHHHIGAPGVGGGGDDARAGGGQLVVAEPRANARTGLDEHLVPVTDQLLNAPWVDAHAVLARLDLSRYSDLHIQLLF